MRRTEEDQAKDNLLEQIIKTYGIGIETLD
jgi:hypothetical protein